jgi:lipopolysaccharide assembly outer membrane protein LptD (OstA)
LISCSFILAEDIAYLSADKIIYEESKRQVIASSNVKLKLQDVEIRAPYLKFDVDQNVVTSTGDITIIRGNDTLQAESLFLDLENTTVYVKNVNIVITPAGVTSQNMYIRIAELEDKGDEKWGRDGFLTTCDYDDPHWSVKAERFDYFPSKGLWGKNVFIKSPIFLPIGGQIWLPFYHYALGKRNPILLIPKIGNNDVEGTFVKTTWDYLITKDQSGEVYLDWMEKKGVGLGVKHNYQFSNLISGSLFLYYLKENDTKIQDYRIAFDPIIKFSNEFSVKPLFEENKGYLINGGRLDNTKEGVSLEYNDLGDRYFFNVNEERDRIQGTKTNKVQFEKTFNNNKDLIVNYNQTEVGTNSQVIGATLGQSFELPYKMTFQDQIQFNSTKYLQDIVPEQQGTIFLSLAKNFDKDEFLGDYINNTKINLNYFLDLDGALVTRDMTVDFLQKMPEIEANFNKFDLISKIVFFESKATFGKYQENRYINSAQKTVATIAQKLKLEPSLNANLTHLDLKDIKTAFTGQIKYVQTFYDTGDQSYSLDQTYGYNASLFSLIKNKISYIHQAFMGNTPFYYDDFSKGFSRLMNTFTLYYLDENKLRWDNTAGWDFLKTKPVNYSTEIFIKPNETFSFNLQTGYHLIDRAGGSDLWDDLVIGMAIKPTGNGMINLKSINSAIIYDLDGKELRKLNQGLTIGYGQKWEEKIDFSANWEYYPNTKGIRLQYISIIKDLQWKSIAIEYNAPLEEYRFKYTIKAFPDDAIAVKTNKYESIKLEGLLNDKSQERFQNNGW